MEICKEYFTFAQSYYTIMEKNNYLLPYSCQKLGWYMLCASLIGYIIFGLFEIAGYLLNWGATEIPQVASHVMVFLVTCLPFLSLIFICLSQEKDEDEYIQSLRSKSLFLVAAYAFIIQMISISLDQFLVAYIPIESFGQLKSIIYYCTNIPLMAVTYLLLFKGTLFVNNIRSKNDGQ